MKIPFGKELANLKVPSLLPAKQEGGGALTPAGKRAAMQLPPTKTPFDAYQRSKLIKLLNFEAFVQGRSVLEVGCGLGDLLIEMSKFKPKELYGVEGDAALVAQAKNYIEGTGAELVQADVRRLPFPENSFDVVLVMYELQHLFDKNELSKVIREVTRVSRQWVILVEQTAPERIEMEDLTLHPVSYYKEKFKTEAYRPKVEKDIRNVKYKVKVEEKDKDAGGFRLRKYEHLHVNASKYVFTSDRNPWHWIRWVFSPLLYLMGFPRSVMRPPIGENKLPDSKLAMKLQKWSLPMVIGLDDIFKAQGGTTVMWFEKERLFRRG